LSWRPQPRGGVSRVVLIGQSGELSVADVGIALRIANTCLHHWQPTPAKGTTHMVARLDAGSIVDEIQAEDGRAISVRFER
jgi:hypothetical protein